MAKRQKILGILSIVFGGLGVLPIFLRGVEAFAFSEYDSFFVNYFVVIIFITGGFFFIVVGVLLLLGHGLPSKACETFHKKKARNVLLTILLTMPFWLSVNSVVFVLARSIMWHAIVVVLDVYILFLCWNSITVLVREK